MGSMQTPCQVPGAQGLGSSSSQRTLRLICAWAPSLRSQAAAFISGGAGICFGCLISISELRPCEI